MDAHEQRTLPEGWEWKKLGEIVAIGSGGTPSRGKKEYWEAGTIPWVKISDISDKYISETSEKITNEGLENSSAKIFPKGTILISIFATLGDVGILKIDAACNQALAGIQMTNNNLNPDFLYYYLKMLKSYFESIGRGVAQNNINLTILKSTKIPLPPLPTQRRIVSILEKAEETKKLRAQADELTDRLLQSVFREMFGVLGINAKGWDKKALGECLEIPLNSGLSPICTDETRGFPVLSLANLRDNGLSNVITKYYQGDKPSKGIDLEIGDILISRSNTRELVGRAGMYKGVPEKVIYPDLLIRIRVNRSILNPVFFEKYLQTNSIKKILHTLAHGSSGSMVKISQENLMNLSIITPPIFLQQKFARIVEKIEATRQSQNQSKQQIDDLFSALMQKAFRGEL